MRNVVVTGVSSGIGQGAARVLIAKGFHVHGSVRRPADAERLRAELGEAFTPLLFDVTDQAAVRSAADQVRDALGGEPLFGLVNNAGVAVAGPLFDLKLDELRTQMEVNLIGVVATTQAFGPLLVAEAPQHKAGRLINITSVGGKTAFPFLGPYHASKFALEGLSESLRRELMLLGVDVIIIAPGAVTTEMVRKGAAYDISPFAGSRFYPALQSMVSRMTELLGPALTAEQLGEAIHRALTVARPRTRYVVAADPLRNWLIERLPKRFADRLIGRQLGLFPGAR